jgi:hypothetical protein
MYTMCSLEQKAQQETLTLPLTLTLQVLSTSATMLAVDSTDRKMLHTTELHLVYTFTYSIY